MIRFLLVILVCCNIPHFSFAQAENDLPTRCANDIYIDFQKKTDPDLDFRRKKAEDAIQKWLNNHQQRNREVVNVPVVVHVIYHLPEENISDLQVWSQINALNRDFRKENIDTVFTPDVFKPLAADTRINFCMAQQTPDNQPTIGILRIPTSKTEFAIDNSMKSSAQGGSSPWDPHQYLNIWVCKLAQNFLGYSSYPGWPDSTDGVVIDYRVFGTIGNLKPNYEYGRTCTHEVGHYFDLVHLWGEGENNNDCTGTDFVEDTPNQSGANYYCPNFPRLQKCDSVTGAMFMNYMDYTYDYCFNMFTYGQADRMWAAINAYRPGLLTSSGCSPYIGIPENQKLNNIFIDPNPTFGITRLEGIQLQGNMPKINVTDTWGRSYGSFKVGEDGTIDLQRLPQGLYFIRVTNYQETRTLKIIKL